MSQVADCTGWFSALEDMLRPGRSPEMLERSGHLANLPRTVSRRGPLFQVLNWPNRFVSFNSAAKFEKRRPKFKSNLAVGQRKCRNKNVLCHISLTTTTLLITWVK